MIPATDATIRILSQYEDLVVVLVTRHGHVTSAVMKKDEYEAWNFLYGEETRIDLDYNNHPAQLELL